MRFFRFAMTLTALVLSLSFTSQASKVDTVEVKSQSMNKMVNVSIITPDKVDEGKRLPSVYLLHGYGDNNLKGWLGLTNVKEWVDKLDVVVVIPDGDTSWYFDSPVDPTYRYETFVTKELISYVDSIYPTIPTREKRAVTGLSMGGHGALYLSIRHQDLFGAVGSMSGGVDFRPFPDSWDIKKRLGEYKKYPDNWNKNTVMAQLDKLENGAMKIVIDCGTEDFFFPVNLALHNALTEKGIAHEFTSRPGVHNWKYWRRSLRDHLLFFRDFFNQAEEEKK